MLKQIAKNLLDNITGKYLPCYVISQQPLIIITYWYDFYSNREHFITSLKKYKKAYVLCQLGWHRETDERVLEIKNSLDEILGQHQGLNFVFLCNSDKEEKLFKKHSLKGKLCHQNAFLDENRYRIIPNAAKKYDAIYVARITPFKRHELAVNIPRLRLIGDYFATESEHYEKIMNLLKHADWTKKVSSANIYKELNSAQTGLCLSAEEGAMFVSAEYLLCGLPVVSTPNMGGRDTLFPSEFVYTAEPTPESVARGVQELIQRNIAPETVRQAVIEKMQFHREIFINIINKIYRKEQVARDFTEEWLDVYIHKLGIRRRVPIWTKWRRGLKH
jgi:glycosyltransferase involved in cell wall biosynthesis